MNRPGSCSASARPGRRLRVALALFVWAAMLAGPARKAWAPPITFVTALPVAQDQAVVRFYADPAHASGEQGPLDREFWNLAFPPLVAWGPTSRLAFFASATPLDDRLTQNVAGGRATRSAGGFGDTLLFARYTLYSFDDLGEAFVLDAFAGVSLPSGWYNKSDAYGRLPPEMQPGSGSVDPYWGATAMWKTQQVEFDWDASYQYNAPASVGYRLGGQARTDVAAYYRVVPWTLPDLGFNNQLWAGVESNVYWDSREKIGGAINRNTGGAWWYVDPAFYYGTPFWTTGAALQLPVIQNPRGHGQLKMDWRVYVYWDYIVVMPAMPRFW